MIFKIILNYFINNMSKFKQGSLLKKLALLISGLIVGVVALAMGFYCYVAYKHDPKVQEQVHSLVKHVVKEQVKELTGN